MSDFDDEDGSGGCCCSLNHWFSRTALKKVMRILHLEKRVVTEDECRGIKWKSVSYFEGFDQLSLVLCVKPKKQLETAIKILKVQQNKVPGFSGEIENALRPLFVLGALVQDGLMTKEDIHEAQKKWKTYDWQKQFRLICRIQCTKEHTVIARTVEILEKCGCTTEFKDTTILKVLGALVQEGLMTKEDVLEVQKEWETYDWQRGLSLICRIQCTKEHAVIARTVEILKKCGCTTEDATILRVLGGLVQEGLMTKEDVHEVQKKWETYDWQRQLSLICGIQCTKEHTVIERTVEIFEKCGCTTKDTTVLKVLGALVRDRLMTKEDVHEVQKEWEIYDWHGGLNLICRIHCTKEHTVIARTVEIFEKCGCTTGDTIILKVLGALVQDGLMTKEDVHEVQKEWETYDWRKGLSVICRIHCTKEHTVIARTVEIFEKCGCTTEDTKVLNVLGTLVRYGLMTEEDVHEVQKEWETYDWQRELSVICRIQCTKRHTVIARTVEIFEKCGCTTKDTKVLKALGALVQDGLMTKEDVHELQKKWETYDWQRGLSIISRIQCTKDHTVIARTVEIFGKCGCTAEDTKVYNVLRALVQDGLMTKEDVHKVQKKWVTYSWQRGLSLICRIQCTKEHTVIARTVEILEKCGCTTKDTTILKVLDALVQDCLVFKEDIHKVQKEWETYDWQGGVSLICKNQCIKEHTVIARTVEILETWNCSTEDTLILKVLGALVQEGLMTKEDVHEAQKKWKTYDWRKELSLICRIQCTKEHTVIARTVEIFEKCGCTTEDTTILKVLGALIQDGLMTKEDVHEVQKKWESYVWQRRLSLICRIQCIKEHTVIARTVEILDQYARTVTVITILKVLGALVQDGLMSKEDLHKVQKEWETNNWQRGLSLICRIQCTKDPTVIARTVEILEKCGCATDERVKELRKFEVLDAIAQDGLMSKEELQSVQRKYERDGLHGGLRLLCKIQSGKEPSVMTRTSDILKSYGFEQEAEMLKVQEPTDQDGLMSKMDMDKLSSHENPSTEEKIDFQAEFVKAAIERGGSVEVEIVKCVTLGPPAAGKTQLKRALSGDVQESTESTPVSTAAEVVMECFIDDKLKWEKFNHAKLQSFLYHTVTEEEYDTCQSVFQVPEEEPSIPAIDRLQSPPPPVPQFTKSKFKDATTPILPRNTTTPQHTQPTAINQQKPSIENAFSSLKERVLRNLSQTLGGDHLNKVRMIHLVDSGGQPAFFDFHPMVATSRAMYLIVYNSEEGLSACPEITYRKPCQFVTKILSNSTQTNLDMIKRSLYTLHHCKKKFLKMEKELQKCLREDNNTLGLGDVLPVIIVGSRKNTCSQSFEEATRLLESHCCNIPTWEDTQPYVLLVESLDPTCSGVKELRETVSNAESKFKIRFPLLWFHCQLIFWSTDDPTLSVMSYQDLRKLCTQHNLVSSNEEFLAMLTTFHMLGIFSCPDLDHTDVDPDNTDNLHASPVFTNPNVLYQQVTRILEIPFYELHSPGQKITITKKKALTALQKSGMLTPNSLALLGVPDELGSFTGFHSYLLNCLLKWGLAAEMPGDPLRLFIPSILPPRGDRKFIPSNQEDSIPPLALTISTEESTEYFVPQGLFPHFVVNIMNRHSKGYDVRVGTGPATPRCRDVIAIVKKARGGTQYPYNIYAVDNIDHISIHINPAQVDDKDSPKWSPEDCHIVVKDLEDSMQEAYFRLFGTTTESSVILCCPCTFCPLPGQKADLACGDKLHLAKLDKECFTMCCLSPENEGANDKDCSNIMKSILQGSERTANQRKREPIPNVATSSPNQRETGSNSVTMATGDIPQPPSASQGDTSPSQHPQSLEFYSLTPSDVGLNNIVKMKPLWQDLAIELGVPVDHVEANESKHLGGLRALKYWRDGHSGQLFPSTWGFLLQKVEATFGRNVAKDLEKKAIKYPTWSKDQ